MAEHQREQIGRPHAQQVVEQRPECRRGTRVFAASQKLALQLRAERRIGAKETIDNLGLGYGTIRLCRQTCSLVGLYTRIRLGQPVGDAQLEEHPNNFSLPVGQISVGRASSQRQPKREVDLVVTSIQSLELDLDDPV